MEFREYPKTWENFLTNEETLKKIDGSKVEAIGFDLLEYQQTLKRTLKIYSDIFWKFCLDYNWLLTRFKYGGFRMSKCYQNPGKLNLSYALFMRNTVGIYPKFFTGFNRPLFRSIGTYIDEFYPDFDDFNPLDYPDRYLFPYENLTCDFLAAAEAIDNRTLLLSRANKEKMTFAVFFDYLLNHCLSVNEEKGSQYYKFNLGANDSLRISKAKRKKKHETKTNSSRKDTLRKI